MSTHWWYVAIAWGLGAVLFGALLADTLRRQSTARRRLAALETPRRLAALETPRRLAALETTRRPTRTSP